MSCMQAALLVLPLTTISLYGLPQSLGPTVSCFLRFQTHPLSTLDTLPWHPVLLHLLQSGHVATDCVSTRVASNISIFCRCRFTLGRRHLLLEVLHSSRFYSCFNRETALTLMQLLVAIYHNDLADATMMFLQMTLR